MPFIIYRFGRFISLRLPLRVAYFIATCLSSLYCYVSSKDRRAVIENMKVLFPAAGDKKVYSMANEVFVNFGKYLVDFFRFSRIDRKYIEKNIKVEGIEYLRRSLEKNKGVILTSAHLGNWELGGIAISVLGFNFSAVALGHRDKQVNRFFISQREMKGVDVIPHNSALRRCFKALGENRVLALVGDRDYFGSGIVTDFFKKPTAIPKGPAIFSRRCGSPIVPCFMIRNRDDTFTLKFSSPIQATVTKDEHADLVDTTKRVVRAMEDVIRLYPTQWCVFRRFWERIPA